MAASVGCGLLNRAPLLPDQSELSRRRLKRILLPSDCRQQPTKNRLEVGLAAQFIRLGGRSSQGYAFVVFVSLNAGNKNALPGSPRQGVLNLTKT